MKNLEKKIGYKFKNKKLLQEALTHKSYSRKHNNENLEFLGDAVLDLSLSCLLMERFPKWEEGQLSQARSQLVNEKKLANFAFEMFSLNQYIFMGEEELNQGVHNQSRLLACALEALVGAIFLDTGYKKADKFVRGIFEDYLKDKNWDYFYNKDYKTRLQERMHRQFRSAPRYVLKKEQGPDHQKRFHVALYRDDELISEAVGRTKKEAEQNAAQKAFEEWRKADS